MARGIAAMLSAHCAVAVTGAGGPNGQDGAEPGTVCFAWRIGDDELARTEHFPGSAEEVCAQTCQLAVVTLRDLLRAVR
jgi:nicotinamide-nucleotide amidase